MVGIDGIRTKLAAVVATVSAAGAVHARMRLAAAEAEVKSLFASGGAIKFWAISLADDNPYSERRNPARHAIGTYRFSLHGFLAVDDSAATEATFAVTVEQVLSAFRNDKKLGNSVIESGPAEWKESAYRTFAGVLVHYARVEIAVVEQVEP